MIKLIQRDGGGGFGGWNIGVAIRAHKKVNVGKQSTPVPKVQKKADTEYR
jgi:hypothetical protein